MLAGSCAEADAARTTGQCRPLPFGAHPSNGLGHASTPSTRKLALDRLARSSIPWFILIYRPQPLIVTGGERRVKEQEGVHTWPSRETSGKDHCHYCNSAVVAIGAHAGRSQLPTARRLCGSLATSGTVPWCRRFREVSAGARDETVVKLQ